MKQIIIKEEYNTYSKLTITQDEIRLKFTEDDMKFVNNLIEFAKGIEQEIKDFPYTFRAYVKQENGEFRISSMISDYYKSKGINKLKCQLAKVL